ncbi:MAG: hypothetical protein H9928_10540, partial [Candidatus Phocaeicola excrementipullorum]|nr:hypothetical protein [Candidatus Phocaeicola excrementipullorum]
PIQYFYPPLLRLFPVCFPAFTRQTARCHPHHTNGNASKTHPKSAHDKFKMHVLEKHFGKLSRKS